MKNLSHYQKLAELFYYPRENYRKDVLAAREILEKNYPLAAEALRPFADFVATANPLDVEELFTRSFDVQAITTLDIGYVLFGDDYKRGEILANLNREHNKVKQDCRQELADHLSNILGLVGKLEDPELRQELVSEILVPALEKMIAEFEPSRLQEKNKIYEKHYKTLIETSSDFATVFQHPLRALKIVLENDFDCRREVQEKIQTSDFLKSVRTEMETEHEHT